MGFASTQHITSTRNNRRLANASTRSFRERRDQLVDRTLRAVATKPDERIDYRARAQEARQARFWLVAILAALLLLSWLLL